MKDALLLGGIVGFALVVLPTRLLFGTFKNLKQTWQGKSKNIRSHDGF